MLLVVTITLPINRANKRTTTGTVLLRPLDIYGQISREASVTILYGLDRRKTNRTRGEVNKIGITLSTVAR